MYNRNKILAPSILSADFLRLGEQISSIEQAGVKYLHLDVMDGHFVDNISFGTPIIRSIRKSSKLVFDVHLMVSEPEKYIVRFAEAGADIINFHIEAVKNPTELIKEIRTIGKKPALTTKLQTPIEAVFPFLRDIDMILVMSVEPGFGGQNIIPEAYEKVRRLREYIVQNDLDVDIEIDGGIKCDNVHIAIEAGANIIVVGSAVFEGDILENIIGFNNKLGETS